MKSTDIIQPTAISQPIANTGTRNTISQTATGTGYASVAEGFPDVTMIAPADGGLPPRGEDCNGLFYLSTDQKVYLQNGGYITFNEEVSELIGGYPQGAILDYYNSDTNVWSKVISLVDDNTNNFIDDPSLIDGTNWKYADIATTSWGSITGTLSNQTDLQETLDSLQTNIDTLQTTVETDYLPLSGGTLTGSTYGITPELDDSSTQLATTEFIKNVLSGSGYGLMTYSKANNLGYIKFANGLILQWGTSSGTITFATAMSNSDYCFLDGIKSTSSGNQSGGWTSKSTTGCVTTYGSAGGLNWMVIGY